MNKLVPMSAPLINLFGPKVREAIDCSEREARRPLRLIADHQAELMDA